MPETPPNDDQFADLFRKLPGAGAGTPVPHSRRSAREAGKAETPPQTTAAPTTAAPADALEELLTPTQDDGRHARAARDRRKSRIAGWVFLAVTLAVIGGLVGTGFYVWNTYEDKIRAFMGWEEPRDYEAGMETGEALVTVVTGDDGSSISDTLFESGVTKTSRVFYDYLISTQRNPVFQPGTYALKQKMTAAAALAALSDPSNKREFTVQLREGLTVEQTVTILSENLDLPLEDVTAAVADPAAYGVQASTLEGWLFPATYQFEPGTTAPDAIRTLVDRAVQSLEAAGVPPEKRQDILTIASIIQREARFEEDFYKVSRVIENRLDPSNAETFGKLQMDSTAQYGYHEMHDGSASSSQAALEDDNPWNTYVHPGLPAGPISNPGDLAIDAAMHPAEGPWLYFVTVNLETGETVFSATFAEHEKAVTQWQDWCSANPESGC